MVTWGDPQYGGDSSSVQEQLKNVPPIQSARHAFAAVLDDGSVVTWGDAWLGADSSSVQEQLKNVRHIQSAQRAFAAVLDDGSVVTWGYPNLRGDSSGVQEQLKNVQDIQAAGHAFADVLDNGSIAQDSSKCTFSCLDVMHVLELLLDTTAVTTICSTFFSCSCTPLLSPPIVG